MAKEDLGARPAGEAAVLRQLLAERSNASAIGLKSRVEAVDKQLKGLGWVDPEKAPEVRKDAPPAERRSVSEATVVAESAAASGAAKRPARKSD